MKLSIKQKIRIKKILELKSRSENNLSDKEIITKLGIPRKSYYRLINQIGNIEKCQNEQNVANLTLECHFDQKLSNLTLEECTETIQFDTRVSKRTEIEQLKGGNMTKKIINYQNGNYSREVIFAFYNQNGNKEPLNFDLAVKKWQNGVGSPRCSYYKENNYKEIISYSLIPFFDPLYDLNSQELENNQKGNNGKKAKKIKFDEMLGEWFDIFWATYPKVANSSKKKSLQAFKKAVKSATSFERIMQALENQLKEREIAQECGAWYAFPCHHSTWLNQARWENEVNLEREFWENEARQRMSPHQQKRTKADKFFKRMSELSQESDDDEIGF